MRRRRSLPWIYRWSRPLIGAIAITGAILTAYLTVTKLTGGEVVCSAEATAATGSCSDVLNSPYATIFGLPLTLFGFLAYISMAIFALSPLIIKLDGNKALKRNLENWTWLLLLAGGTAMAAFSSYLMYVLFFKLQAVCYYCIGSALFSWTLLTLAIMGREWEDIGQIFFTIVIVAMLTLVGALGVYANVDNPIGETPDQDGLIVIPQAQTSPEPPIGWEITTTSGEAEIALAKHLTAIGIKNYGAFWCPHCYEQKQLLGKEAFQEINYIECDPQGKNPQREACVAAGIKSFPTWEIKGKFYPGVQTPQQLAELSEYKGSMDFKYKLP
ncbi:Vitamin K epoxide reductase [Stanieria sp. NIES-3757]|nr:Vitamin K epoxide reductase [Stanieria sp. NIES-3757]